MQEDAGNHCTAPHSTPSFFMSTCSDQFKALSAETIDQAMIKIEHCVAQLNDAQLWWRPEHSMNSVGNLVLHLAGNLRQWGVVPFTMAKDRRDRESEFVEDARVDTTTMMERLRATVSEAKDEWQHLSEDHLNRKVAIQGFDVSLMQAIMHTSNHFVGHTHQIIQLTRTQLGGGYRFHWTPSEERGDLPV